MTVRETTYGGKTRWQHVHNGRGEFQESRADREGWLRSEVTQGQFCFCGAWLGVLGLEPTPELYTEHVVELFREVRRVLRGDGTLWLNLGDCFNAYNGNAGPSSALSQTQSDQRPALPSGHGRRAKGLKPKDLIGIPWRVAFALQADGWWLRSDIIWSKPNPMPESVIDRPTSAHEHVFLLAKSRSYFYDAEAIREPASYAGPTGAQRSPYAQNLGRLIGQERDRRDKQRKTAAAAAAVGGSSGRRLDGFNERWDDSHANGQVALGRNKRNVWEIATQPYPDAHFATFPPKLVEPCILAGSSRGGGIGGT